MDSVWRSAINASVIASEKAMEGQTKVTQKYFVLCGPFEEALPATASEMGTLKNNGTKIYQRNIDSLLSYCLNVLGNDKAILAAKYDLMGLLVMLCSGSDYVTHFHHENDVNYVLEEVQYLLSIENDGNKSGGLSALCDGQAFVNLICHLAVNMGVSLHIFLRPFIDFVSEWCRLRL